jgi:hypothetical protein
VRDLQIQANVTSGSDIPVGIYLAASPITLRHVTVTSTNVGSGGAEGVKSTGSSCTLEDLTITVSGPSSGQMFIGLVLEGLTTSKPTVRRTVISVSGAASENDGIWVSDDASPTLLEMEVQASGGTTAQGLFAGNFWAGSVTLYNSNLQASGATNNYGLSTDSSSNTLDIEQSKIVASSGTSYGFYSTGISDTIGVNRCELNGGTSSVHALSETFNAGASRLVGTVSAGTAKCVDSYNGSYTALSSTCTQKSLSAPSLQPRRRYLVAASARSRLDSPMG